MRWPWQKSPKRRLDKRRIKAELELEDAEHRLELWGHHPGTYPSERQEMLDRIEAARAKIDRIRQEQKEHYEVS